MQFGVGENSEPQAGKLKINLSQAPSCEKLPRKNYPI